MMKRVIDDALKEHKADELRASLEGLRRLYLEMSHTITIFRESEQMTIDEAMQFYEHAFEV